MIGRTVVGKTLQLSSHSLMRNEAPPRANITQFCGSPLPSQYLDDKSARKRMSEPFHCPASPGTMQRLSTLVNLEGSNGRSYMVPRNPTESIEMIKWQMGQSQGRFQLRVEFAITGREIECRTTEPGGAKGLKR